MDFLSFTQGHVVKRALSGAGLPGIGFALAALLSMFLAVAAQAQTDTSGSSSSTVPTLTIAVSSATATEGDEITYTITASSAPSAALPVVVHVRAHGEVMDTRTVAEVLLPSGATTVTLRLEEFTDEIDESPVNVTLTLAAGTGYRVGDPAEATVSIDYPSISGTQATPTPAPAVSPPDAPSGVSISSPTINSFTVSWTAETGKSYRVEREAAFLFSYGVWQTVADNLSTGSFTESDLPCDLFYVYQVRAMVAGSAYGASKLVLGQAQSCTAGTSDGARAARSPSTPVRKLRLVTDRPTETSIRIRLLFHRNMDEGDLTHTPVYGMKEYRVYRTRPGPPITQTPVPADWVDPVANPEYRMERTVSEFDWTGLACGTHYWFRALGHGDGVEFEDDWGNVWSNAVHGSSRGCNRLAAPVVDVIPVRERRAWLTWKSDDRANEYYVQVRRKGETSWPTLGDYSHHTVRRMQNQDYASLTIYLDRIMQTGPITNEGLAHNTAFEFQVQARHGSDDTLHSNFSDVVSIVDSPILSANGDAGSIPIANRLLGKIEVKWKEVGEADDDVHFTLRWRKLSGDHTQLGWSVTPGGTGIQDSEYEWNNKVTSNLEYTLGGLSNLLTRIETEKVYALQLNYTINGEKYFSAREAYAWSSHRAAGDGERVATFPLNYPVSDKTYAYRICEDGFPAAYLEDWKKLIKHALEQWEVATGLVTMTYVGATCADYTEAIADVAREFNVASGRVLTAAELNNLRSYLSSLDYLTSVQTDDEEFNEIIMVNNVSGPYAQFKQAGIFPEFSEDLGIGSCVFNEAPRACATPRHVNSEGHVITDITLSKSRHGIGPVNVPGGDEIVDESDVRFNTCPGWRIGDDRYKAYATMVHEAGHALGIRDGGWDKNWAESTIHHPTTAESVVNYELTNLKAAGSQFTLPPEPNCSPHPLDIMAIYAIYQTK